MGNICLLVFKLCLLLNRQNRGKNTTFLAETSVLLFMFNYQLDSNYLFVFNYQLDTNF